MITQCSMIVMIVAGHVTCSGWSYQDEDNWSPLCQKGSRQSPIALNSASAKDIKFTPFNMTNYGTKFKATIKNNGHSAEIRPEFDGHIPRINGGGLDDTYEVDNLHFHWQSEHIIDSFRFPLELHIVHYAKKYNNLNTAKNYPGGIAVVAVLFDLSLDDDMDFQPLVDIIDIAKDHLNAPKVMADFMIKDFVPRDHAGFFRYDGSLTTPECNEGVVWTIFTSTLPISRKQVHIFELLRTEDDSMLVRNYRSLQPLNGRNVYLRRNPVHHQSSSANNINAFIVLAYVLPFFLLSSMC